MMITTTLNPGTETESSIILANVIPKYVSAAIIYN